MASPRILDVGMCGVDGPRISRFLKDSLNAHVDRADTKAEALAQAGSQRYDLVMVNRVLNADRSPGLDVIAAMRKAHPGVPVMLISDYDDAQQQAEALGAVPGFGKAALDDPETQELLQKTLERSASA